MVTAFNTMFKNEARLLNEVLKIWKHYPIDYFIFYDDNSTDNSIEIIKKHLDENRYIIVNNNLPSFNESYQRQKMIDVSRNVGVDIVFAIDCDELLSANILRDWDKFLSTYETQDLWLYWYNCVDSLNKYRNDPQYANNYRSFVLPLKHTGSLNKENWKYHTPRTPNVNLPKGYTKEYGVIHLQALNKRFYAIKQLWYKHHEFVKYNHTIDFINSRYDGVVNNFNFNELETPIEIINGIDFNINVFDELEKEKGYLDFILNNKEEKLITFGKEFL